MEHVQPIQSTVYSLSSPRAARPCVKGPAPLVQITVAGSPRTRLSDANRDLPSSVTAVPRASTRLQIWQSGKRHQSVVRYVRILEINRSKPSTGLQIWQRVVSHSGCRDVQRRQLWTSGKAR